ncbi:energy-coupled thiamine transporter ThiT [Eubacterium aggregans]|uniref:energy-coupled thiamine transporter ThiT n=1 Tax=Eubacterium aggregans TaxID=81409 RepID=UPI003F398BF9
MLNVFVVPNGNGSYALSTGGYIAAAVVVFLILILASTITQSKKCIDTRELTFAAVAIALTIITSFIKLWHMPMGGSITLFSMLFITLIGYWYGPSFGILTGVAYGLLQLIIDPYILSVPQLLLDYPLSFGALGLSGFFSKKKKRPGPGISHRGPWPLFLRRHFRGSFLWVLCRRLWDVSPALFAIV